MAQTKTEASELLAEVREALDLDTLTPPRGIAPTFREVGKKLTFGRGATPYAIADVVGDLCAYGYYARAADAALLLGRIDPQAWDITYMYVRDAIHTAYFFSVRAGDHARAARLEPLVTIPGVMDIAAGRSHHAPQPRVMDGSMLKLPFEGGVEPIPNYPIKHEDRLASAAVMDLRTLAPMWIFGGSAPWPRERLLTQVDSTLHQLHQLPGWHPW